MVVLAERVECGTKVSDKLWFTCFADLEAVAKSADHCKQKVFSEVSMGNHLLAFEFDRVHYQQIGM
jgi:hypothetical protein